MLDADILIPLFFFLTLIILVIGLPLVRARVRRWEREGARPDLAPGATDRLERMEVTLDAVALEIERISENQRFTTRLLSEGQVAEPVQRARQADAVRVRREEPS